MSHPDAVSLYGDKKETHWVSESGQFLGWKIPVHPKNFCDLMGIDYEDAKDDLIQIFEQLKADQ